MQQGHSLWGPPPTHTHTYPLSSPGAKRQGGCPEYSVQQRKGEKGAGGGWRREILGTQLISTKLVAGGGWAPVRRLNICLCFTNPGVSAGTKVRQQKSTHRSTWEPLTFGQSSFHSEIFVQIVPSQACLAFIPRIPCYFMSAFMQTKDPALSLQSHALEQETLHCSAVLGGSVALLH